MDDVRGLPALRRVSRVHPSDTTTNVFEVAGTNETRFLDGLSERRVVDDEQVHRVVLDQPYVVREPQPIPTASSSARRLRPFETALDLHLRPFSLHQVDGVRTD